MRDTRRSRIQNASGRDGGQVRRARLEKRAAAAARAAFPEIRNFAYTFERWRSTVRTLR